MRHLIFLVLLCVSCTSLSQEYGDKAHYLIDSLDISTLNSLDSAVLQEQLVKYHGISGELKRLVAFNEIPRDLTNPDVQMAYSTEGLSRVQAFITKRRKELTPEEYFSLKETEGEALTIIGLAHSHHGDHQKGLSCLFEVKKIGEEIGSKEHIVNAYINIGTIFYEQNNLQESLIYHEKGALLNFEIGDSSNALYLLNNMGAIYNDLEEYDKAKVVLDSCIKVSSRLGEKRVLGMALNNLGGVYCENEQTIDTGIVLLERSLKIFEELQFDQWLGFTHSKLAKIYLKEREYNKAHENGLKAEIYAEKLEFKELIRRSSLILKKTYFHRGDYKNAFLYSEKYARTDRELRGEQNRVEALRLENKFTLEKQKEIDRKELALANAAKNKQQIINYVLIGGTIGLFLFSLFIIYRLRLSNRQKLKIEQQSNERSLLLKEIHHRVKNNFQIISSLLRLQAAEENSERIEHAFDDAVSRIQSMASVHELIYKQEMFAELSTKEYLDKLVKTIRSYSVHSQVKISAETEIDRLNIKTLIPIGITINELVTNSLKYAFEKSAVDPQIEVKLTKSTATDFTLTYKDNGVGYDPSKSKSNFGMELIDTIMSQIDGVIRQKNDSTWKNKIEIQFKEIV